MKKFNPEKFLTTTISFAALHTSLICAVLIPFFKDNKMTAMQLAIILTAKKIARIITDIPFGIMLDRFGGRVVFGIGRLMKIGSFLVLLLKPSFSVFIFAMILDSLSYSAIYGKINVYIYNNLSNNNYLNKYSKFIGIYYLVVDVVLASVSLAAGILLKYYGYNTLIYISILTGCFSFVFMIFLPSEKDIAKNFPRSKSFSEIIQIFLYIVKNNKILLYLLIFYGFGSFLAWQFGSIGSMILLDMKFNASEIAFVGVAVKFAMGLGCLIPIFIYKYGISIQSSLKIFMILIFMIFISSLFYNDKFFILSMLAIILSYSIVEISVEIQFEKISNPKIRGTITSLGWSFCSILSTVSIMLLGFMAEKFSYKYGLIVICGFSLIIMSYLYKKLINIDFQKSLV